MTWTLTTIIYRLTDLVLYIVPILVALALLYFFWGLGNYILNVSDTDKRKEGTQRMVWGMVALFFILSIAGVVAVLQNTFFPGGYTGVGSTYGGRSSGGYEQTIGGPVRTGTGGVEADVRSNQREPGFFRATWCVLGFGNSCN